MILIVALFSLTLFLPSFAEMTIKEFDTCSNINNYVTHQNADGIIVMSKHLSDRNCIQINVYKFEDLRMKFYDLKNETKPVAFDYNPKNKSNITQFNTTMTVQELRSNLVYTDPKTGNSMIYLKTNMTEIIFDVPFTYSFFKLKKHNQIIGEMWLDVHSETNDLKSFNIIDRIMLVIDLLNIMVVVDIGIIFVILFRKYNIIHQVHSTLMWVVLVVELLSLCYFLLRYQNYFWSVWIFLAYFLFAITINIFSILNTSIGVFLLTAIFEKHISQNVPVIKRIHKYLGYLSYALMKLKLVIKILILIYNIGMKLHTHEVVIILINPVIWLLYAATKITKYFIK